MNIDYEKKYLIYKKKYLELKQNAGVPKNYRNSWVESCGKPNYKISGDEYLKNVNIDENIKNNILQKLFIFLPRSTNKKRRNVLILGSKGNFSESLKVIYNEIENLNKEQKKEEWINCKKNCFEKLKNLIDIELNSTAYILKALSNSVVQNDDTNIKLNFKIKPNSHLTGIWEEDKDKIDMKPLENNKKSRLLMGFGPSASGKTYWAKSIIKMLSSNNDQFPKAFLSIDGGIYREQSIMYQNIIKSINNLCNKKILGFSNLFSKSKGLFNSPKGKIYKYLLEQANKNVSISLYVPETIGKCITCRFSSKSCHCGDDVVKKFNKISKDNKNWIGLFIWQHKTAEECNYINLFRCKGTTKSGKSRELTEGKKYSSKAYEISYHGGLASLNNAPGGRIIIHNGGGAKIYDLGEEFIEIFVKHLVDEFKAKHDIDLSKDKIVMPRLRREGTKLKYIVEKNYGSMKKDYKINLPYITYDGKKVIHIETKLTVNQFENLLGPLIKNKKGDDSDKFTKSIIREIILPNKKSILNNVNFDDYNAYYIYGKDKKNIIVAT